MQIVSLHSPEAALPAVPRAVALGLFDGVHLGHRRVLSAAVGHDGLSAAVFTFGHQAAALKADACALCSKAHKQRLFEILGMDEWLKADFDAYRNLSPEAFVEQVLCRQLNAKCVCVGEDFRFGKHGAGDIAQLKVLCAARGIDVIAAKELCDDGVPVRSRRIRRLIEAGDIPTATRLLGHPFVLDLPVVHGHQLGRKIGSPTANQVLPPHFVVPRKGVYTSTVVIDGNTYYGVSNVGVHPTVGAEVPTCETWIENFDGDIYGRTLQVILTRFLRDEQKFASLDELKTQIRIDREHARALREENGIQAVLFDFDDTLQNRPVAFKQFARYFIHRYRPDVTDETKQQALIDTMFALNNSGYVDYIHYFTVMPKAVGIANPLPAAVLFKEYQRVFPTFVSLFDDAASTLTALREKGYRIGIVTNGPLVQQHRKLDVSGLRLLCDTVVVSDEEGVKKPDPEIFFRAAARLGLSPAQCLMVGDHPEFDIEGALAAGMHAVFIDTRRPSCRDGVPVIHKPSELLNRL